MRSSPFVVLSITAHVAAVGALVWLVSSKNSPSTDVPVNEKVEVAVTPPPATPAATEAPVAQPAVEEAPQPKKKPKASVAALLKRPPKSNVDVERKALAAVSANSTDTDDRATEAAATEAQPVDPAPVGVSEQGQDTAASESESSKSGDSKEAPVSYMGLKQVGTNKPPAYPIDARRERRQGELELVYHVTEEGTVEDISVSKSSGHEDLDKAALDAVSKYRFEPGQESWARHPIAFSLKGPEEELPSKLRTGSPQADVE